MHFKSSKDANLTPGKRFVHVHVTNSYKVTLLKLCLEFLAMHTVYMYVYTFSCLIPGTCTILYIVHVLSHSLLHLSTQRSTHHHILCPPRARVITQRNVHTDLRLIYRTTYTYVYTYEFCSPQNHRFHKSGSHFYERR